MTLQETLTHYQKLVDDSTLDPQMPAFLLIGQDVLASRAVRCWAEALRDMTINNVKVGRAIEIANAMSQWPTKRVPGYK